MYGQGRRFEPGIDHYFLYHIGDFGGLVRLYTLSKTPWAFCVLFFTVPCHRLGIIEKAHGRAAAASEL